MSQTVSPRTSEDYDVFCVETGSGPKGSIYVCSVSDKSSGGEVAVVQFNIAKTRRGKTLEYVSPSSFREKLWELRERAPELIKTLLLPKDRRTLRSNLKWLVKKVIEMGWTPSRW